MLDAYDDQISVFSRGSMTLMAQQEPIKAGHNLRMGAIAISTSKPTNFDNGKYVRYTAEQVQALERLYNECPKPSSLCRQQLVRDNLILQNIEPKQIKVWFQNRRCREKQRKETSRLQSVNSKLSAMNKLLMDENDRLQKQVAQLLYENGFIRQQLQHVGGITTDTSCDSAVTNGLQRYLPIVQHLSPLRDGAYTGIMSLAEEAFSEFLEKAMGTAMDWIPLPGMKPGPDSTSMVNVSHSCAGIAARACGLIGLDAGKIAEFIKDKPSWQRECRRMSIMFSTTTSTGGCMEVLYVQTFAPTTLALAKDFYTLRYTSMLDDGSILVCEKSLNSTHAVPMVPQIPSFERAEMHASGCLIRPCEASGSVVIIIDHMDLESQSVPEVLRPLYESSAHLAHKLTMAGLKHLRHIAQEVALEAPGVGQQPAAVRSLSHRLVKGFNEAVNGFLDDGWSPILGGDGMEDVTIMVKNRISSQEQLCLDRSFGGILCAKASMLLQNISPAFLVHFLREQRSEWADNGCEEAMHMGNPGFFGFCGASHMTQLLLPQVHAIEEDEFLELIKVEGQNSVGSLMACQDMFLLQLCSGLEENSPGAGALMVFAPIDASISEDITLVPSGFRVVALDQVCGDQINACDSNRTLDLASALEVGNVATTSGRSNDSLSGSLGHSNRARSNQQAMRSVLTIAFQFSYMEMRMEESVASIARQYVQNVVATVQRVAMAFISTSPPRQLQTSTSLAIDNGSGPSPLNLKPAIASTKVEHLSLARCLCQSYKLNLGIDLVHVENNSNEAYLKALGKLADAVLCCSCESAPMFIFANQAGLDMLETSASVLQDLSLEKTLDESSCRGLCTLVSQVMQEGYAYMPGPGLRMSSMGRAASYERAIAWTVVEEEDSSICKGLAFLYTNWALV